MTDNDIIKRIFSDQEENRYQSAATVVRGIYQQKGSPVTRDDVYNLTGCKIQAINLLDYAASADMKWTIKNGTTALIPQEIKDM